MNYKLSCLSLALSLMLLVNINTVLGQVDTESNADYIRLNSYNGSTTPNAFTFRIQVKGASINYPNWSLLVRANQPIRNGEGKTFDPSKISIRINNVSGGPTLQTIGATNVLIPLSFSDQALFRKSNYPIKNGPNEYYNQYIFTFDIVIAGGNYLEALKSYNEYSLNLTFTILRANDAVLSQANAIVKMQIYPTDNPPIVPTYGIQINGSARSGVLEFKTLSDYVNGVSQLYPKALSVTSNTPYAIQVKSSSANLESGVNSLPMNTVSLELKDPDISTVGGTVILSENNQTVFNAINISTQARSFDIRYFTRPNDVRMINSKPANYQTTLTYTLIPQ